jgi:transposase
MATHHVLYYGIDVSKDSLQIAYECPQTKLWKDLTIANEIAVIDAFVKSLNLSEIHFVYEHTGSYSHRLTFCLHLANAKFSIIGTTQSKGFSQSLKISSKTDKSDARMLCLYGQKMQPQVSVIDDEALHHKRQKHSYLAVLQADKQAFDNRKHALLYDPRASKAILDSIEVIIVTLQTQIEALTEDVFTISDNDAQNLETLITSVVGIGKTSAEALIIATNGFNNFESVKQLAKFLGVCPSEHRSGSSVFGKHSIVKSGQGIVRGILYMAARSARKYNLACKDIYERLRTKGKAHKLAMMAVVHKLVKQVFAVVKSNTLFDNNFALAK